MLEIASRHTPYIIKTDFYPFEESRRLLKTMEDWWDHPARIKYEFNKENYSLDSAITSSLENSFRNKLKNGIFSFLYYGDICVSYGGLQVDSADSWLHRYATNPRAGKIVYSSATNIFIPYQIFYSLSIKCNTYSLTFNHDHLKIFKHYNTRKHVRIDSNSIRIDKFDLIQNKIINNCRQLIYTLDLTRNDINEFFRF